MYNRWFASGILQGRYPEEALEGLAPHMPDGWQDDFAAITAPLDWIGVNYYTCKRIAPLPGTPWPALEEVPGPLPKTDMGWEIYPEGMHHFLTGLNRMAGRDLPIYVTENGMAAGEPEADASRIAYLESHLAEARRAIAEGVPLKGYFIWSLLDNYEWSFGYEKRFGLVHVDFETLERRPKASWHALARALSGADAPLEPQKALG
ncbi:hypothetical protein CNY89_14770 [Amaricoccus sp. HAR-UPW-R2A-40]|nr:hypothetical protein CNY89_14770 [Amaricoccus sp. HAR-UPW-R2A-40]